MSYKTILVCLTNETNAERLTKAACTIARKFNAHLIGLHTMPAFEVYPSVSVHLPVETTQAFKEEQARQAENIKKIFEDATSKEDFVSEWRLVKAQSSNAANQMAAHARCAGLVIMPQADPEIDREDQHGMQRTVIETSGRPVLVIPHTGTFETFGEHVLVGWSATREAARAAHDAMPFVENGGKATILWVSNSKKDSEHLEHSAHELAASFDRHGATATVAHWQNAGIAIGDALLNESFERGADMIATGAFGHSRFYDFVIGATTTHLLDHMTAPVLFSN